jgi:hypothetical protein
MKKTKGMILAEILLAGAVLSLALGSVVIIIGGLQSMLVDAQNSFDAGLLAREEISLAHIADFDGINSFEKTDGLFTTTFSASYRNAFTTDISADVSWYEGSFQKRRVINDQIVDWRRAPGAIDCDWLDGAKGTLSPVNFGPLNIESGNPITGVTALGDFVYVSADSATSSLPDLYVLDVSDINGPKIVSRLNTGPGIASVAAAGHYVFSANAGSYQMQIVDVADPVHPVLVSQAKLPGVVISGSAGFGQSVHFFDNKMYIGLVKNVGFEFFVVDVSNPQLPVALGSYEIGSTVNDIDVQSARAVVVTPGQTSVFVLDVSNPAVILEIAHTSLDGWQTQGAKSVEMLGPNVSVGRTLGGFYSPFPEYVLLDRDTISSTTASLKIGASIEDILAFKDYLYITTSDVAAAFQILHNSTSDIPLSAPTIVMTAPLSSRGVALTCNNKAMYVVTQSDQDFFHIFSLP